MEKGRISPLGMDSKEDVLELRQRYIRSLLPIGIIQMNLGSICIVTGVIFFSTYSGVWKWPVTSGASLWGGIFMFLAGVFALIAYSTKLHDSTEVQADLKGRLWMFYAFVSCMNSSNAMTMGFSIASLVSCATDDEYCTSGDTASLMTLSFHIAAGFIAFMVNSYSMCWWFKRTYVFGIKNRCCGSSSSCNS